MKIFPQKYIYVTASKYEIICTNNAPRFNLPNLLLYSFILSSFSFHYIFHVNPIRWSPLNKTIAYTNRHPFVHMNIEAHVDARIKRVQWKQIACLCNSTLTILYFHRYLQFYDIFKNEKTQQFNITLYAMDKKKKKERKKCKHLIASLLRYRVRCKISCRVSTY